MIAPQYRPILGGYERAAERLSIALVARGHYVTVVTERRDRSWPARERRDGVEVRRLPCVHRPRLHALTALASLACYLLLRGRRHDVWHVHQYGASAAIAIALGRLLARPVVLKLTSSSSGGVRAALEVSRLARFFTALHRRAAAVVALTEELDIEAIDFGIPADRVHRLGNGVDTAKFCPRAEPERERLKHYLGLGGRRVVLYVGRLAPEKDPVGLLRAWRLAAPRLTEEWLLAIAGVGPLHDEVARLAADPELVRPVRVLGARDDVDRWMGAADVYVSSSRVEGLSNTMLEAMASGLPVLVTRVSGTAPVAEEGSGLVVEPGNVEAMADALALLAADADLRERLGAAGRRMIERTCSIGIVARQYESMYRSLLNGTATRAQARRNAV